MSKELAPRDAHPRGLMARLVAPLVAVSRAPRWLVFLVLAVLAVAPYVFYSSVDFRSDDILLTAQGVETGVLEGLWRNLSRPFCDTWTIEFYRPLFTWSFCVDGQLFGGRAEFYFLENLGWHILAVLAGYVLLRRLLGLEAAFFATLLFLGNPWSANNVSWLVGRCGVVSTLAVFLGTLAYLRHRDRSPGRRPWAAFGVLTVGVFYRETTAMLLPLIALIDLAERRLAWRRVGDWLFLSIPIFAYLIAKLAVLGTLVGGYARTELSRGPVPEWSAAAGGASFGELRDVSLRLLVPGGGTHVGPGNSVLSFLPEFDALRVVTLAAVAALFIVGAVGRAWRRPAFWALAAFAVLHAAPLLAVDRTIHAGTSQRWYLIMWAIAGAYAAWAAGSRWRSLSFILLLVVSSFSAYRLAVNLADYDRAADLSKEIRSAIDKAPSDLVFVQGIDVYQGASAFYAVGLGQTQLEPFRSDGKMVFPVFNSQPYAPPGVAPPEIAPLPPVAAAVARTRDCTMLRLLPGGRIETVSHEKLKTAAALLSHLPVMEIESPRTASLGPTEHLELRLNATGLQRLEVHLFSPLAHVHLTRYRDVDYHYGAFEGDSYREDFDHLLLYASLLAGASDGLCWLWIVGYDEITARMPVVASPFIELESRVPHVRP